jgi:hypothetical protein
MRWLLEFALPNPDEFYKQVGSTSGTSEMGQEVPVASA